MAARLRRCVSSAAIVAATMLQPGARLAPDEAHAQVQAPAPAQPPVVRPVAPAPPAPAPGGVPMQQPPVQVAPPPPRALPASPYDGMARMTLEANFAGPLRDTLIQRWRDPIDGTVCYVYLPISVPHGQPLEDGIVRYGANPIGSITCVAAAAATAQRPAAAQPAVRRGRGGP